MELSGLRGDRQGWGARCSKAPRVVFKHPDLSLIAQGASERISELEDRKICIFNSKGVFRRPWCLFSTDIIFSLFKKNKLVLLLGWLNLWVQILWAQILWADCLPTKLLNKMNNELPRVKLNLSLRTPAA
jgi:hypothetical protein